MLPSVLLLAGALLGPACCGATPTLPATETTEQQASLIPDEVRAEMFGLCEGAAAAGTAESLAALAETLAGVQANVAAVSGRLDLILESQIQQQNVQNDLARKLEMVEQSQAETSTYLQGLEQSQEQIFQRLEGMSESQTEVMTGLEIIGSTLNRLEGQQLRPNEPGMAQVTEELVYVPLIDTEEEASLSGLSSRVDRLLQQQHRAAAAAANEAADLQRQLNAIQADVSLIPKIVLGRECSSDAECSSTLPEAVCGGNGLCSCRDGYRQVSNTECRRHARLSEPCLEDATCQTLTANATCTGGVCACADGFWNNNNAECRQVSAVDKGDTCVGDQDCNADLQCITRTCSCPTKTLGDYEYRLTGGASCSEGNVELRRTGASWGRVCDDNWESSDGNANVVCRSLGYDSGQPTVSSAFGCGPNFYMDEVRCDGSESHLMECLFNGWGQHNCYPNEVAGVRCFY